VAFTLAVFFVSILDGYVFVHEVLAIHVCDCVVRCLEVGVRHEAVAFRETIFGITRNFGGRDEGAKAGERVVECFLIYEWIKVTNKEIGANFDCLLLIR
jgi:hypothetical protein